ncbi:unnamed protein product, partial [Dicrocoelium dendriticum]
MPQGSVLGTRLFLTFIRDLSSLLRSNFLLFADDVKSWHNFRTADYHMALLSEFDKAYARASHNRLQLKVEKCKVVNISHQLIYEYRLGDQQLQHGSQENDVKVIVQYDLGCSKLAEATLKIASQDFVPLRRDFGNLEPSIISQMLNAYVRPH